MNRLPVELLAKIFNQLKEIWDHGSLSCAYRVCKVWREVAKRFLEPPLLRLTCLTGFESMKMSEFFIAFGSKEGVIDVWKMESQCSVYSHNIFGTKMNFEFEFYLDPTVDFIASKEGLSGSSFIVTGNITASDIRCWEFHHSSSTFGMKQLWQRILPKEEPVKSLNAIQIRDEVIYSGWFYSVILLDLKTGSTLCRFLNDPFMFMEVMITKTTKEVGDKIVVRHYYPNTDRVRALELKDVIQARTNDLDIGTISEKRIGSWTLPMNEQKQKRSLVLFKHFTHKNLLVIVNNLNYVYFGIPKESKSK